MYGSVTNFISSLKPESEGCKNLGKFGRGREREKGWGFFKGEGIPVGLPEKAFVCLN